MGREMLSGIGHLVALVQGNKPLARDTTVDKSTGFDRTGFQSCVLEASVGDATGTPTSFTSDFKLQHSDTDVDGNYVDYKPDGTAASGAVTQMTAAGLGRKSISLDGAKKYVRVYHVNAFSGGTTPKVPTSSNLIFGGAISLPAQSDT